MMKKKLTLVALALGISSAFAQELKSKKDEVILPEAGDWGLAIDATPFLTYAGNFFGKTASNNAPGFNFFTNAQTITGRYFKDAKTVYRGSLRLGFGNATEKNMVTDVLAAAALSATANGYPAASAMKENTWNQSNTNIGLAFGFEKRKGKTRLQGYYGAEAGIFLTLSHDKFTYGNGLAATSTPSLNVGVTAADAFTNPNSLGNMANNTGPAPINGLIGNARVTDRNNGTTFSFGARAFIGAEYFILPKMSIGGEFGWGLGLTTHGKISTTYESIGNNGNPANTSNAVGATTIASSNKGLWALDTDGKNSIWGASGTIRLNLYF